MEKKYALTVQEDGRILTATFPEFASQDATFVDELPEGDITNYRLVAGKYVYDPILIEVEVEKEPSLEEQVAELREALDLLLSGATE